MTALRYAPDGVTTDVIGDHGLGARAYDAIQDSLEAARSRVVSDWKSGKLGFMGCPDADTQPVTRWAKEITADDRFRTQVVFGIGGSSLGARAVLESAVEPMNGLETHFSENMDPVSFGRLIHKLDLEHTLFVVITKSGSTVETMSKFWWAWQHVREVAGEHVARHFVAVTDPEKGSLRQMATELGIQTFDVPQNVGGRFSVLTPVGLLPLALAGYPIGRLMEGAKRARDRAVEAPLEKNALLRCAADHALLLRSGYTQTVMMAYSDLLGPLVEWFCQLWGESLGKAKNRAGEVVETGLTPIKALGVVDQHSQIQLYAEGPRDKHVTFLEVEDFGHDVRIPDASGLPDTLSHLAGKSLSAIMEAELVGTRRALEEAGRPTSRWIFESITPEAVGAFLMSWEFVTAVVGELLDINAFDQPGVELGKKMAHGLLGRPGFEDWAKLARKATHTGGAMPID